MSSLCKNFNYICRTHFLKLESSRYCQFWPPKYIIDVKNITRSLFWNIHHFKYLLYIYFIFLIKNCCFHIYLCNVANKVQHYFPKISLFIHYDTLWRVLLFAKHDDRCLISIFHQNKINEITNFLKKSKWYNFCVILLIIKPVVFVGIGD